ncbi:cupin domain-containing protein [Streptomyces minutiscleroticus]|uniref:cupin domain-containing protein n=1 Tax=Streptomyces minutiscleroticus TaxID=68238 RepID=UPI003321EAB7
MPAPVGRAKAMYAGETGRCVGGAGAVLAPGGEIPDGPGRHDAPTGGAGIALHTHDCPESVTILEGDAVVEIDGTEHHVTRFDTTYVPAGMPHRFRNASATEPMRILWIHATVDVTRTMVETGVTARGDAEHHEAAAEKRG